jgi:HSP20 family protein
VVLTVVFLRRVFIQFRGSSSMSRSSHWRREPFVPIQFLQNELARLLEEYLQPEGRGSASAAPTDLEPTGWSPFVDVYETPEATLVVAEIPGVDPAKVELSITGNLLVLRGAKETGDLPEPQLQVRERRFGAFHRQIMVPSDVDFEAAQADARNGVLTIRLPKHKAAKPRNIPIRPS